MKKLLYLLAIQNRANKYYCTFYGMYDGWKKGIALEG